MEDLLKKKQINTQSKGLDSQSKGLDTQSKIGLDNLKPGELRASYLSECDCDRCKSACQFKPGIFLPEEIKIAADYMKMTEKDFFKKYLAVDYFYDEEDILMLAPNIVGNEGNLYPFFPKGTCVFYEDGCTIHEVKPFECRAYIHTDTDEIIIPRKKKIVEEWQNNQNIVLELAGEVETPECQLGDLLNLLLPGNSTY